MTRALVLPVFAFLGLVSCDKVPLTSPTGSSITISVDRTVLPLNGEATVTAVVIESAGTLVHNGTMVTFQSTIGTMRPVEVATVNGIARSTLVAGNISGKGTVTAFSGAAPAATTPDVVIGAAAAKTIAISATPSSVSQSGGTVTVSALVLDESGNPLPGVNVNFSATAGQLSAATALSDAGGFARTQLTTSQNSTVTASAGAAATNHVDVVVSAAPTITITAPDTGMVGVPVAITVAVTGGVNGAPRQVQSLTVDFGDGAQETRGNVTGSVGLTHTYQQARGFTITATATDVSGNTGIASDSIVISRQPLPTVTLVVATAIPNTITATSISFGGGATPPAQIVSARVTLQDGTVIYSGTAPNNFGYRFTAAGTYTLTGTVTDSNGQTATTTTSVVVIP
jgi:adhesin/invasin